MNPKLPYGQKRQATSFTIEGELINRLNKLSELKGINKSRLMTVALEDLLMRESLLLQSETHVN